MSGVLASRVRTSSEEHRANAAHMKGLCDDLAGLSRAIRLGGLVEAGSVQKTGDGVVAFVVTDNAATTRVVYHGDLPDLFREGQGIVADGTLQPDGSFQASRVLAKHDENYMPRDLANSLKEKGVKLGKGAGQ